MPSQQSSLIREEMVWAALSSVKLHGRFAEAEGTMLE
jgi:hypothetical protein